MDAKLFSSFCLNPCSNGIDLIAEIDTRDRYDALS